MKAGNARILLTGATGGIGQASALALLQAGASLMLVGRSASRTASLATDLAGRIPGSSGRIEWRTADLNRPNDLAALADTATAWGANVVVHNAGVASFGRFESFDAAAMQQVLNTNLLAPMLLTQALLPHLRREPRAQIICIGSALGRLGLPGYSVYSASKFGLRGFTEALRRELGDTGVRLQYLGPRATRTDFNTEEALAYQQATGTASDAPQTVALALVKLLEDEAAERFIGFPESLAVRINGFAPGLLDGSFNKHRDHLPTSPAPLPRASSAG